MRLARERGLDLVEVAPTAVPPVCRILDFGKFKYEQQKKESETRRNAKTSELKEVRLTPGTDEHDLDVSIRKARGFLEDGDKVKVTVKLKSRTIVHPQLGRDMLERFAQGLQGVGQVERGSLMEGRALTMIVSPVKSQPAGQSSAPGERPQRRPRQAVAEEAQTGS